MAACEKCWADACSRSQIIGGFTPDHYVAILRERTEEKACTPKEQCGSLHVIPTGMATCRCGWKKKGD